MALNLQDFTKWIFPASDEDTLALATPQAGDEVYTDWGYGFIDAIAPSPYWGCDELQAYVVGNGWAQWLSFSEIELWQEGFREILKGQEHDTTD